MADIPNSIKILHSLGLVKIKSASKKEPEQHKGTLPKGFNHGVTDGFLDNHTIQKKTKTVKLSQLILIIPIFLMVLIPIVALLPNNNTHPIQPAPLDLTPVNNKFTDAQIIEKYPSLVDLDRALNSGELNVNQVSDAMHGMIKQQKLGPYKTP